eukprot:scaffold8019_cov133-Isochrysis_galbana.AAC.4
MKLEPCFVRLRVPELEPSFVCGDLVPDRLQLSGGICLDPVVKYVGMHLGERLLLPEARVPRSYFWAWRAGLGAGGDKDGIPTERPGQQVVHEDGCWEPGQVCEGEAVSCQVRPVLNALQPRQLFPQLVRLCCSAGEVHPSGGPVPRVREVHCALAVRKAGCRAVG